LSIWILLIAAGMGAGVVAGLLGLGGGAIVVPLLVFLAPALHIPPQFVMPSAVATSLVVVVFASLRALSRQSQRRTVLSHGWPLLLGAIVGAAVTGWWLPRHPTTHWLTAFGVFEILIAWHMVRALPPPSRDRCALALPPWNNLVGATIGSISTAFGIGGGSLTVPYLLLGRGWPMLPSVTLSNAVGAALAVAALPGFLTTPGPGWGMVLPEVAAALVLGALIAAPWGVKLGKRLPEQRTRQIFAIILGVIGLRLIAKGVGLG